MKRFPLPSIITAAALVLVLVVYMVTFQVRFNQAAVKVWLGTADEKSVIMEPGLYFKWPYPIEQVRAYDMRLRTLDTPDTEMRTQDGQPLIVGCFAVWKVADPLKFFIRAPSSDSGARDDIRNRINESRSKVIGSHNMSDLFNLDEDAVRVSFDKIEQEMLDGAKTSLANDYGIELVYVGIRRLALPAEATSTVQQAMQEDLNKKATEFREEGKSNAAALIAKADAEKKKILSFADRRAQEIISQGEERAAPILKQIEDQDAEFFIWLRYLSSFKAALSEGATVFRDWDDVSFPYFNDPMMPITGQPTTPDEAKPATPQPVSSTSDDSES